MILSFFPCTRFEAQILLWFRGEARQQKKWSEIKKLETDLELHKELSENYKLITMLAIIVLQRGFRMVFENPLSDQHYLQRYWCLKSDIKDQDRRENGDYFQKPTQYWFIGFEPKQNLVFEPIDYVKKMTIGELGGFTKEAVRMRSMIHPQYASRFIRQYLIDERKET